MTHPQWRHWLCDWRRDQQNHLHTGWSVQSVCWCIQSRIASNAGHTQLKGRGTHKFVFPLISTKEPNLNSSFSILVPLHLEERE